jgi:hypothetical protein
MTWQTNRHYAQPAEDECRRLHHCIPLALQALIPQDATPDHGQGQRAGPLRRRGADAGSEGGGQVARLTRRHAAQNAPDTRCRCTSSALDYRQPTNSRSFVCAISKETSETVCLTSYRTVRGNSDLFPSMTIREVCRATSAATPFFDPTAMGRFREDFVDGAIGANNASEDTCAAPLRRYGQDAAGGGVCTATPPPV